VFEPIDVSSCATCHEDPHRPALDASCASCHTERTWRTDAIDHSRTDFPLRGLHASVECVACHTESAVKVQPKADSCATCHDDVHRGSFAGQDCAACHTEAGFEGAPFDHTVTTFALTGSHAPLACSACHEESPPLVSSRARASAMVDFTGLETSCASCHADPHQEELGPACESCHSTETFELSRYTHADPTSFFEGEHADVSCDGCHRPSDAIAPVRTGATLPVMSFTSASETCATCHRDVHLGQLGTSCESCHAVETPLFAVADFAHAKTAFALEGSHAEIECQACHKVETGLFPAGEGTAVRLKGVAQECSACHEDVHLGQLNAACETCHDTSRFTIADYTHQRGSLEGFFSGSHLRAACESCHQPVTQAFPSGHGTAVRFQTDTSCISCHEDRHRGSLGSRCVECHRP